MHGIPDIMIPGKTWSRYCCLRFSSHSFSLSHGISSVTRSHSARSWCQIPWVLWFLARTKPRQSEAEQNPAIWTRTILPGSHLKAYHLLIIELNPIVHRNLGRRHSVSVSWTNLIDLVLLHEHWLLENAHRSCKQSLFFARIGRLFGHVAPRHFLFFENAHAGEAFSMQTQSKHQAYRIRRSLFAL